jgi:hypothetical protein
MKGVFLQGIGLVGPGLPGWSASREILAGKSGYRPAPIPRFNPDILPVNERRRITPTIRLALQAALDALQGTSLDTRETAAVFVSSNGDLEITDRICNALALPERPVSPVDFHNSVHNAPAGYWAIGSGCRQPSTSVSAGTASFAAGLLEAITQTLCEQHAVLLVAYDWPSPSVLARRQRLAAPFAAALVLSYRQTGDSLAIIHVEYTDNFVCNSNISNLYTILQYDNPAAEALPLLKRIAGGIPASCVLPYLDQRGLLVEYAPC